MQDEEALDIIDKSLALSLVLLGQMDDFVEEMTLSDGEYTEHHRMKEKVRAVMDHLHILRETIVEHTPEKTH